MSKHRVDATDRLSARFENIKLFSTKANPVLLNLNTNTEQMNSHSLSLRNFRPMRKKTAPKWRDQISYLQSNGSYAEHDETLKQRLRQSGARSLLAHDNRTQLTVVSDEHELSAAKHDRYHALGLSRLRRLVYEDRAELHLGEARVTGTDACTTDHIGILNTRRQMYIVTQIYTQIYNKHKQS